MKVGTICSGIAAAAILTGCFITAGPASADRGRSESDWKHSYQYAKNERNGGDRRYDNRYNSGHNNRGRTDNTWNNGRYNRSGSIWDRLLGDKKDKRDGRDQKSDRWDWDRNRDYRTDRDYRDRDYRDYTEDRYDRNYGYGSGGWLEDEIEHRKDTKNSWRNIAIAAGAISVLGMLQNDKYLTFGGAAGALYSYQRYQQDKKSQDKLERARASYFDREWFERDGRRYERRTVVRNGQSYYQFCRR